MNKRRLILATPMVHGLEPLYAICYQQNNSHIGSLHLPLLSQHNLSYWLTHQKTNLQDTRYNLQDYKFILAVS